MNKEQGIATDELIIDKLTSKDEGRYVCKVRYSANEVRETSAYIHINSNYIFVNVVGLFELNH